MRWADKHTCHSEATSPVFKLIDNLGEWRAPVDDIDSDGYPRVVPFRTCSYCGSIHPEDVVELAKRIEFAPAHMPYELTKDKPIMELADMKYGRPHKIYIHSREVLRPDLDFVSSTRYEDGIKTVTTSKGHVPWIKFYTDHLLDKGIDDEAFAAITDVIENHVGLRFSRDDKGMYYRFMPRRAEAAS